MGPEKEVTVTVDFMCGLGWAKGRPELVHVRSGCESVSVRDST